MKREEFLKYCETLTNEDLHRLAQADRDAFGSRIPPEVHAMFSSLDSETAMEEFYLKTAFDGGEGWKGTHFYVVKPLEARGLLPVVINVHGGGWCKPETPRDRYFSRRLAKRLGVLVVNVDYVLAPEYPYPAALEEIEALLNELPRLLPEWGGDAKKVIFCGQSSGANLLAGVSQRKRYTKDVTVLEQILCYPPCDNYSSHFGDAELGERDKMTEYYGFYYNRTMEERKNSDVSLTFASEADTMGLPPTHILTAALDNLMPEARRYFELLQSRGVPSTYRCFPESNHGFVINLNGAWKEAEDYICQLISACLA